MADTKTNLSEYLKKSADYVNSNLKNFLPKDNSVISKAMRYSVMAGGKRLRPAFVILGAEIFGLKKEKVME